MLYVGSLAGIVASNAAAHAVGINAFRAYVANLVLLAIGLISGRLLYVTAHWSLYRENPHSIWNPNEGGATMYGGLMVVLFSSAPLLAILGLPLGKFWDATVFGLLILLIFGRIGCLLNGCCAGRASRSSISVRLPNSKGVWERRIPTQVLEAAWAATLFVGAIAVWRWLPFPGALFLVVAMAYGAGRLGLESMRELAQGAGRFTMNHAISMVLMGASLATLAARWPK